MVNILKQLRQFTAPCAQKVNGDKLDDSLLAVCGRRHPPTCFKIGRTADEWLEEISETLRGGLSWLNRTKDEKVIEEKLQEIKDNFPSGEPFVLTHGDFNLSNIIVKDDKIVAIIDWESSGYYPWWAEKYFSRAWCWDDQAELFEGVWDRVGPGLEDGPAWTDLVEKAVAPVQDAIANCKTTHTPPLENLYRGPFCKCRPYGQRIKSLDRGAKCVHEVFDWERIYDPDFYKNPPKGL